MNKWYYHLLERIKSITGNTPLVELGTLLRIYTPGSSGDIGLKFLSQVKTYRQKAGLSMQGTFYLGSHCCNQLCLSTWICVYVECVYAFVGSNLLLENNYYGQSLTAIVCETSKLHNGCLYRM